MSEVCLGEGIEPYWTDYEPGEGREAKAREEAAEDYIPSSSPL